MATKKRTVKRHKRGFYVKAKGKSYAVMHQPTAGKPTITRTFRTKKEASAFVRQVKGISSRLRLF